MKTILKYIADAMADIEVPYHFMRNRSGKVTYPYFVSEIYPVESSSEDGREEFTMMLTGFDRNRNMMRLLDMAAKIKEYFPPTEGLTAIVDKQCIAVFASLPQPVDSGEEELQKLQINLNIKRWREKL